RNLSSQFWHPALFSRKLGSTCAVNKRNHHGKTLPAAAVHAGFRRATMCRMLLSMTADDLIIVFSWPEALPLSRQPMMRHTLDWHRLCVQPAIWIPQLIEIVKRWYLSSNKKNRF